MNVLTLCLATAVVVALVGWVLTGVAAAAATNAIIRRLRRKISVLKQDIRLLQAARCDEGGGE